MCLLYIYEFNRGVCTWQCCINQTDYIITAELQLRSRDNVRLIFRVFFVVVVVVVLLFVCFFFLHEKIRCNPSVEPSRRDGFIDGSQHILLEINKKYLGINLVIWSSARPVLILYILCNLKITQCA